MVYIFLKGVFCRLPHVSLSFRRSGEICTAFVVTVACTHNHTKKMSFLRKRKKVLGLSFDGVFSSSCLRRLCVSVAPLVPHLMREHEAMSVSPNKQDLQFFFSLILFYDKWNKEENFMYEYVGGRRSTNKSFASDFFDFSQIDFSLFFPHCRQRVVCSITRKI